MGNATQIRVPIDDTHTAHIHVQFHRNEDGSLTEGDEDPPVEYVESYKDIPDGVHPYARFNLRSVLSQDHMAWETQGPVMDRSREHLGTGDKGIVIFRKMLREQIEQVRRGAAPLGCVPKEKERPLIELDVINERIGVGVHKRVA